jgi:hypothetical protein
MRGKRVKAVGWTSECCRKVSYLGLCAVIATDASILLPEHQMLTDSERGDRMLHVLFILFVVRQRP